MEPGAVLMVVIGAVLVVVLWVVLAYNALVRLRNHCVESWADIDTELKRRHDLVPNLVETVKGYAAHERGVFEQVVQARNAAHAAHASPAAQARDENVLIGGLRQLMVVAEAYPDLKANQHFLSLQQELANTEDRIQRARRFYNANVRDLNTRIEVVPSSLIAGWFKFEKREYFEIDDGTARQTPSVKLG
jgi:LemA protein